MEYFGKSPQSSVREGSKPDRFAGVVYTAGVVARRDKRDSRDGGHPEGKQ
jgi:hypothetical protein